MMMLLLILYPMLLLSGAFSPPESMGLLMRYVGLLSPVRHHGDFGYQVLFKGNGLAYVWPDIAGILALASDAGVVWLPAPRIRGATASLGSRPSRPSAL